MRTAADQSTTNNGICILRDGARLLGNASVGPCGVGLDARTKLRLDMNDCDRLKAPACLAVGVGATVLYYSDRRAATVIAISKNGSVVTVQHDKQELVNGADSGEEDAIECSVGGFAAHFDGAQRWRTERDPNGCVERYSRRMVGDRAVWVRVGDSTKNGQRLSIGDRSPHYDFNF